jgi:hypothetical protein
VSLGLAPIQEDQPRYVQCDQGDGCWAAHLLDAKTAHNEGDLGVSRGRVVRYSRVVMEEPPPVTVGLGKPHRTRLWRPSVFELMNHPTA